MKKMLIVIFVMFTTLSFALDLDESIKLALENNLGLKAQAQSLKSAKADEYNSYLNLIPSANISMNYMEADSKIDWEGYSNSTNLIISQPIFNGGKIFLGALMSRDGRSIEEQNFRSKRLSIIADTESKYFAVLELKDFLEISKKNYDSSTSNLKIAEIRFDAGTISKADLLQLKSDKASKNVSYLQAENRLQLSIQDLKNFLQIDKIGTLENVEISQYQKIIDLLNNQDLEQTEKMVEGLNRIALLQNPTLVITNLSQSTSKKGVWMAAGNFLPSLNFSYTKNWLDTDLLQINPIAPRGAFDNDPTETVMLNISLPIFPIVDNGLSLAKANYNLRKANYNADSAEDAVLLGIKNTFYTLILNAKTIDSANLAYEYAQETYKQMDERYKNGLITTNDLLSASVMLSSSRSQYTSSKYNFLKAQTSLLQQLGTDDRKILDKMILGE